MRGALLLLCGALAANSAELPKADPAYPFRTDFTNGHLPWHQLKPGEFPPLHSEHRVGGELVEADFIHRSGQFRAAGTGELVDFTLPPFGTVMYLNTQADLRDVPLGTHLFFFLYQDKKGAFTRAAKLMDDYSLLAGDGFTYRLDALKLSEGKLVVRKQSLSVKQTDLGRDELLVNHKTRVWKGDQPAKLSDLTVGDDLLINLTGGSQQSSVRCSDIWVGVETHKLATEQQRKQQLVFLKDRGLPGWIDAVAGKTITVTLLGDPASLQALFKDEQIVPTQWAAEKRRVTAAVANEELRSYNPPVDQQGSKVLEYQTAPTNNYGSGGARFVLQPSLLLEGFRKGHIIRIFKDGWPVKDMPFGESIYPEIFNSEKVELDPNHYPFRTDFANEHLPWYQLKPGEFPPNYSAHQVGGELVKVDAIHRSGQFRADGPGELVNFTLPPFGSVMYLNAEADLRDLPLGGRYLFSLHQDEKGAFTKASLITDEFTHLVSYRLTYRLAAAKLNEGLLLVAKQIPPMKNELDAMVQPPDLGRSELTVDDKTRVWKGDQQIKLIDLAIGDELLVNLTGRTAISRGRCTDIWAGLETHKLATGQQRTNRHNFLQARGLPAWIDKVEGKTITITFFSAQRKDFFALLNGDPWGKSVSVVPADGELRTHDAVVTKLGFKNHLPEAATAGTYGCSGVRWVLEANLLSESYRKGQIIRVFKEVWPIKVITELEKQ